MILSPSVFYRMPLRVWRDRHYIRFHCETHISGLTNLLMNSAAGYPRIRLYYVLICSRGRQLRSWIGSVPPAVAGGCARVTTHPLPQVVLTVSKHHALVSRRGVDG